MEHQRIEEKLDAAEKALAAGDSLNGTGFWPTVSEMKRHPELAERYAERVAAIDRAAFENWALLTIPIGLGTTLAVAAVAAGLVAVGLAYSLDEIAAVIIFTIGLGLIITASHGLGHLVVGKAVGMRFTYWFVGQAKRPQPGVKVDYSTYLTTSATSRAWMHASGAIVTKLVPFVLLGAAVNAGLPAWYSWGLAAIGVAMVITDVLWSTKASDWKKYRREMEFAQSS